MGVSIIIAVCFIWIGFIGAISFMESWVKFRSEEVTLPIGLSIGRLVFRTLNRMEWVCLLIVFISAASMRLFSLHLFPFAIGGLVFLLLLQSFIWLPKMSHRAQLYINGETPPPSKFHFFYVAAEMLKLALLLYIGIRLFLLG